MALGGGHDFDSCDKTVAITGDGLHESRQFARITERLTNPEHGRVDASIEVNENVLSPETRRDRLMRFTAANGDTLTAAFTGQSTPTATPTVHAIEERATITGGTGRFASAVGSFTVERVLDLTTLVTSGSFEGTISVPAAVAR